ncbi:MAG TPA: CARDB domain-containing protein [Candidatus Paceibacterota bacterium]|nr:CARDB domain-containing protein [Candidatus Paceibacterota bacterium]
MADQQQAPGLLANILAVAGFIILIVIIVWGAYQLLRLMGSGVSSLFSRFGDDSEITVTVPNTPVQSGRTFPISWQYSPQEDGAYAFLYQCKAGFRFDIGSGTNTQAIPCGNAFVVGNNTSLTLMPVLSGTTTVEVPVTVVFLPNATSTGERPQGTATVRVAAASGAPSSTTTGSGQTSSKPSGQPSNPQTPSGSGQPDLSVRILAVGVIDASGAFVQRTPSPYETAAVQFDIKNEGSTASGSYRFSVQLPTQPVYPYISPVQASLSPGSHVVSTLRFGPVAPGGGSIAVEVDAARAVRDANRSNNTATTWINASAYPYYQYPAPYVY